MEIDPKDVFFPLATAILTLIALWVWSTGHIKGRKKYVSIEQINANRDFRIPVEWVTDGIFDLGSPEATTLGIKIVGAYLKDDQWRVDLGIGEKGKIFTGGLKISVFNSRLFVRFQFFGSPKDMWL